MPHTSRSRTTQIVIVLATMIAVTLAALGPATTAQAQSTTARREAGNPLVGGPWGIDTRHEIYKAYDAARGKNREPLGKMALRPRVFWFHDQAPINDITRRVRAHIEDSQDGNPNALVHMAVFRLWPEGEAMLNKPLTLADRSRYRRWIDNVAKGIGSARVVLVLEPDLAVALQGWRPSVRISLTRYAARVFSKLPRTTMYIDAGSADWLSIPRAVSMLRGAGIGYARGFSLGATHYAATGDEIEYGTRLVAALAKAGFPRRRFVVDTSDNGRPFTWLQYWAAHPLGDYDNAEECRTLSQRRCVTLGIPPTTDVDAPGTGLTLRQRRLARANVDAYLWFSRPWMVYARPAYMDLDRALAVARTTPF